MSAPQPPEAAVEAGARALAIFSVQLADRADSRMVLAAALPHLHRDWLEGLIAKYESAWMNSDLNTLRIEVHELEIVARRLRAELAEEGDEE